MSPPALRIKLIEDSFRCFVVGLFGVVPLLSLAPGLVAIYLHGRVVDQKGEEWNPAQTYAAAGCVCGWVGVALTAALLTMGLLMVLLS